MGSRRRRKKLGMAQRILILLLSVQLVENRVRGNERKRRKRREFGNFTGSVKDNIGTSMQFSKSIMVILRRMLKLRTKMVISIPAYTFI